MAYTYINFPLKSTNGGYVANINDIEGLDEYLVEKLSNLLLVSTNNSISISKTANNKIDIKINNSPDDPIIPEPQNDIRWLDLTTVTIDKGEQLVPDLLGGLEIRIILGNGSEISYLTYDPAGDPNIRLFTDSNLRNELDLNTPGYYNIWAEFTDNEFNSGKYKSTNSKSLTILDTPIATDYFYVGTTKPTSLDQCTVVSEYPTEQIYTNNSGAKSHIFVLTNNDKNVTFINPELNASVSQIDIDTTTIPGYNIFETAVNTAIGGSIKIQIS